MAPLIRNNRSVFSGVGVIVLAVIVSVIALAVYLNQRCVSQFWDQENLYPGATLVESDSVFLGRQQAVYHTDDPPEVVNAWISQQEAALRQQQAAEMREALANGGTIETQEVEYPAQVAADAERGGSIITFAVICPSGSPPL